MLFYWVYIYISIYYHLNVIYYDIVMFVRHKMNHNHEYPSPPLFTIV